MKLKLNDVVEWESHGAYWKRKKRGRVVKVIPPLFLATAKKYLDDLRLDVGNFDRCSLGYGPPRKHRSYLIIGEEKHKGMFKIFWPRVSQLKKVE